jgi:hypothetical protein
VWTERAAAGLAGREEPVGDRSHLEHRPISTGANGVGGARRKVLAGLALGRGSSHSHEQVTCGVIVVAAFTTAVSRVLAVAGRYAAPASRS